jgi:hypothetical protein
VSAATARIMLRDAATDLGDVEVDYKDARAMLDRALINAHAEGVSIGELVKISGLARNTVRTVLRDAAGTAPDQECLPALTETPATTPAHRDTDTMTDPRADSTSG